MGSKDKRMHMQVLSQSFGDLLGERRSREADTPLLANFAAMTMKAKCGSPIQSPSQNPSSNFGS